MKMIPNIRLFLKYNIKQKKISKLCDELKKIRSKEELISEDDFFQNKKIAKAAYPEKLNIYKELECLDDFLLKYDCKCIEQVFSIVKKEWYFIAIKTLEGIIIKDFAAINGKCREIMSVVSYLYRLDELFNGVVFYTLSREITSYPFILLVEKKKKIKILTDKCYVMDEEYFHDISFKKCK